MLLFATETSFIVVVKLESLIGAWMNVGSTELSCASEEAHRILRQELK